MAHPNVSVQNPPETPSPQVVTETCDRTRKAEARSLGFCVHTQVSDLFADLMKVAGAGRSSEEILRQFSEWLCRHNPEHTNFLITEKKANSLLGFQESFSECSHHSPITWPSSRVARRFRVRRSTLLETKRTAPSVSRTWAPPV